MSNEMLVCKCGFKFAESILTKTQGYCPVCKEGREDWISKYSLSTGLKWSKKQ